jgi:hypothetical protein
MTRARAAAAAAAAEAKGDIETAHIAVTTLRARKPVAFMSAQHATGSARIFIAPSRCEKQL